MHTADHREAAPGRWQLTTTNPIMFAGMCSDSARQQQLEIAAMLLLIHESIFVHARIHGLRQ